MNHGVRQRVLRRLTLWYLDREAPSWLRRRVKRDPSLREYEEGWRGAEERLRGDAAGWCDAHPRRARVSVEPPRGVRASGRLVRVACGLLIGCGLLLALTRAVPRLEQRTPPPPGSATHRLVAVYDEVWRVSDRSAEVLAKTPEQVFDRQLIARVVHTAVESAARTYGQALAEVDRGLREQRDRMTARARGVVDAWTQRRP